MVTSIGLEIGLIEFGSAVIDAEVWAGVALWGDWGECVLSAARVSASGPVVSYHPEVTSVFAIPVASTTVSARLA